jgi:hypothetical protein
MVPVAGGGTKGDEGSEGGEGSEGDEGSEGGEGGEGGEGELYRDSAGAAVLRLAGELYDVVSALERAMGAYEEEVVEAEEAAEAAAAAQASEEAWEPVEEAEELRALASLETQVWLELDALLRAIASRLPPGRPAPVPSQLLGLLPPPPDAGWPDSFALAEVGARLEARYRGAMAEGELRGDLCWSYVPYEHGLPPP